MGQLSVGQTCSTAILAVQARAGSPCYDAKAPRN